MLILMRSHVGLLELNNLLLTLSPKSDRLMRQFDHEVRFRSARCYSMSISPSLIERIASDDVLDQAYQWLCDKRAHYHFNGDVWQLRRWWRSKKADLQNQLLSDRYQFRELRLIRGDDRVIEWWSSMDALVLKAIALVLGEHLQPHLSERCFHLAGTGGMKAAVREVSQHQAEHKFVFRTDVKKYYASIDHKILLAQVRQYVDESPVVRLIRLYLQRFVSDGGVYVDILQGISLGCPLSPLMGALYLKPLDDRMAELGCFYVRYMDDWVVLTPTRWKLRRAIKAVNEVLAELKVEQHPDKTLIGRIAKGFDFLGYWFSASGFGVARKTVKRMLDKVFRLYEQGADAIRIETYLKRWWRWVRSGVDGVSSVALSALSSVHSCRCSRQMHAIQSKFVLLPLCSSEFFVLF